MGKIYYIGNMPVSDELYHYGRKGMKWGKNIFEDVGRAVSGAARTAGNAVSGAAGSVKKKVTSGYNAGKKYVADKTGLSNRSAMKDAQRKMDYANQQRVHNMREADDDYRKSASKNRYAWDNGVGNAIDKRGRKFEEAVRQHSAAAYRAKVASKNIEKYKQDMEDMENKMLYENMNAKERKKMIERYNATSEIVRGLQKNSDEYKALQNKVRREQDEDYRRAQNDVYNKIRAARKTEENEIKDYENYKNVEYQANGEKQKTNAYKWERDMYNDTLAGKIENTSKAISKSADKAVKDIKSWGGSAIDKGRKYAGSAMESVGKAAKSAGKAVSGAAKSAAFTASKTASKAASSISSWGKTSVNKGKAVLSGIFGKKKKK